MINTWAVQNEHGVFLSNFLRSVSFSDCLCYALIVVWLASLDLVSGNPDQWNYFQVATGASSVQCRAGVNATGLEAASTYPRPLWNCTKYLDKPWPAVALWWHVTLKWNINCCSSSRTGNRQCGPVLVSLKNPVQGSPDRLILYLHQQKGQEMHLTKTRKYMEISRFYMLLLLCSKTENYI